MNIGKINTIGFGKIVKVNAPISVAEDIADIVNKQGRGQVYREAKKIFNDVNEGKAYAFGGYSEDESYILSGKEGNAFWASYAGAWDTMDYVNDYYGTDDLASIATSEAWEYHRNTVREMIETAPKVPVLNVDYDKKTNEIKSLNLIG